MVRIFLSMSLAAACCCFCIALLPAPAQGRPGGLAAGGLGGRINHQLPVPEPTAEPAAAAEQEQQQQQRGVPVRKTRPAWSPAAAEGSVRPELRAVPGGPDPLHHHGGSPSRRPEQGRTPSP